VLTATLLAFGAAALHASWNLVVKQSADRWTALWAQQAVAGVIAAVALVFLACVGSAPPAIAWPWALLSGGCLHLVYLVFLGRAYDHGDFSVSYPIARGGGALLAAVGGILLLGDDLSALAVLGITITACGLGLLVIGQTRVQLTPALIVAALIATYTLVDAHGSRESAAASYVLVLFLANGVTTSLWGVWHRGTPRLVAALRTSPWTYVYTGVASALAYGMVLVAVRYAPVGYVTAIRESSVVIAALLGWRYLGEADGRRRMLSAMVVLVGLVLLIIAG
jgi:drug/metabolite transporter (DMT)-like permease